MGESSARLQLRCPAKLNWNLRVLGRRPDGFHELDSWFVGIGLFDTLTLSIGQDGPLLQVDGPTAGPVPADERNLILQAERLWREAGGEIPSGTWHLHKRIPSAAGLGGGSSDAAAALRILQSGASIPPVESLERLALQLGSDVPFFLQAQSACRMGGRGEHLLATDDPGPTQVVLAVPGFPVPTAEVFRLLDAPPLEPGGVLGSSVPSAGTLPASPGPNDLLRAALESVPALADFAAALAAVAPFHLSGSGGCFFHLAEDATAAAETASRIELVCAQVHVVPLLSGPLLANPSMEK